jgi:hypothetical protein
MRPASVISSESPYEIGYAVQAASDMVFRTAIGCYFCCEIGLLHEDWIGKDWAAGCSGVDT